MRKFLFIPICLLFLTMASCSSDSDDDMIPPPDNSEVTYTKNIKSIIDSRCISCHSNPPSNGAPMSLTTYENVRDAVQNRNLIARVEDGSMPPAGSDLTSAQVQAIKDWEEAGFPE